MTEYIICIDTKTRKLTSFDIPLSVHTYIKQLEQRVRYPDNKRLDDIYPHRFYPPRKNSS